MVVHMEISKIRGPFFGSSRNSSILFKVWPLIIENRVTRIWKLRLCGGLLGFLKKSPHTNRPECQVYADPKENADLPLPRPLIHRK